MSVYVWIIMMLCTSVSFIQTESCKREQRCRISRIHKMKGADCYKKDMRTFPQCLPSDVEIVDLSYNRIRKLNKNDLKKYSSLKMLYLSDNVIVSIDEESFEGQDDLTTLDLSLNAISKLPPVVFHLPSLKTLYLGQNLNINIADVVEKAKPVTSPLVQLDISYVMSEEPNELPDLGILPFLKKYNISGNKLIFTAAKHFAGLCDLKILDTQNVTNEFSEACDCWTVNHWLKDRGVNFKQFECETDENVCSNVVPLEDMQLFDECMKKKEAIVQKSRMVKILIPVAVGALLILIVIVYCVVRRRKQRLQQKRIKLDNQHVQYDNNILLQKESRDNYL